MEKLTWFKFVISDWMMGKIQKCPEITQARFIRLCCLYWNKECMLSYEDAEIEIDEDHLKILLAKKIVLKSGEFVTIKFLDEQNEGVSSLSDKRSAAAHARWERIKMLKDLAMQDDAIALNKDAFAMQNDADEMRVEERREDYIHNPISEEKKSELIQSIANEWGVGGMNFKKQQSLIISFVKNLEHRGLFDHFKSQNSNYKSFKDQSGQIKHSFNSFFGSVKTQFEDALWNSENWESKLKEHNGSKNPLTKGVVDQSNNKDLFK